MRDELTLINILSACRSFPEACPCLIIEYVRSYGMPDIMLGIIPKLTHSHSSC